MGMTIKRLFLVPSSYADIHRESISPTTLITLVFQSIALSLILVFGLQSFDSPISVVFSAISWPFFVAGLLEPLFNRAVIIALRDEQELYWRRCFRDGVRIALLIAINHWLLISLIGTATGYFIADLEFFFSILAFLWFAGSIIQFLRKSLNFGFFFSMVIAGLLVLIVGIYLIFPAITNLLLQTGLLLTMLVSTGLLNQDLFKRLDLIQNLARKDFFHLNDEESGCYGILELLHLAGSRPLAERYLHTYLETVDMRPDPVLLMRLLNATGKFMESVELGLGDSEDKRNDISWHCAMAEASFGARDSENAIAHAEEAYDLSGGLGNIFGREALLINALASFNELEQLSAVRHCILIGSGPDDGSLKSKRIKQEAEYFMRKFADQSSPQEEIY
jgi:hypothetical protein